MYIVYIYIYTYTHTHTHIYIYIYTHHIHIYIHINTCTSPRQPPAPAQPNCHTVTNRGSGFVTSSTPSTHSATTAAYVRRGGRGLHFARRPRKKNLHLLLLLFLLLLWVNCSIEVTCRCCPLVATGEPRIEPRIELHTLPYSVDWILAKSEVGSIQKR